MKLQDFDFRVWDDVNKKYIKKENKEQIIFNTDSEFEIWTGIIDCNDKKIYENDILEVNFNYGKEYNYEKLTYRGVVEMENLNQVGIRNAKDWNSDLFYIRALIEYECSKYNEKVRNIPMAVHFNQLRYITKKRKNKGISEILFLKCKKLKILGNIHENAELLKEKNEKQ